MTNPVAKRSNALSAEFDKMLGQSSFTPTIQLIQGLSKIRTDYTPAENGPKKPEEGMFFLGKDRELGVYDDRGYYSTFDAVPVAAMPHALYLKDGKGELETFEIDDLWRKIEKLPKENKGQTRPLTGGDVLLWLPELREFAIYFMHSSARSTVRDCAKRMNTPIHIRSKKVGNSQNKWYVPSVLPATATNWAEPSKEALAAAIKDFHARIPREPEKKPADTLGR